MFGVTGLVLGDFATVWQPVPADVPYRAALAYCFAVLMLAGGMAVQWRRTARAGLMVLAVLYLLCAGLWVPRIVGYPRIFGTWSGFTEEFVLVVAAIIAYASLAPYSMPPMVHILRIGRTMFGICVLVFGGAHFAAISETTGMVPQWLPLGQRFWALATGAAFLLAGVAIIAGMRAVLASRLLTAMLITFGVLVWVPIVIAHPESHTAWGGNAITLAVAGAAWIVADTLRQTASGT